MTKVAIKEGVDAALQRWLEGGPDKRRGLYDVICNILNGQVFYLEVPEGALVDFGDSVESQGLFYDLCCDPRFVANLSGLSLCGNDGVDLSYLESLVNLKVLTLRGNNIKEFPRGLSKNLKKLESLDLQDNPDLILDQGSGLGEMIKLEYLLLSNFTGRKSALSSLPEDIGNLRSLKCLRVENCALERFPESIKNCLCLESVVAQGSCLETLPVCFGSDMPRLKFLVVADNCILENDAATLSVKNCATKTWGLFSCGEQRSPGSSIASSDIKGLKEKEKENVM